MQIIISILCWLLVTIIFIYAAFNLNISKSAKWLLSIGIFLFEIGVAAFKLLLIIVSFKNGRGDDDSLFSLFIVLELIFICLYRINKTHRISLIIGACVFIALAIYMYFNGSVMGDGQYIRVNYGDFYLYQISTFAFDVMAPFALVYNLIISPFWLRKKKVLNTENNI